MNIFEKLCFYDTRNPDFSIKEEYGYDKKEVESCGEFSKKDCACDNCFYGRSKLANIIIESNKLLKASIEYFKNEYGDLEDYEYTWKPIEKHLKQFNK